MVLRNIVGNLDQDAFVAGAEAESKLKALQRENQRRRDEQYFIQNAPEPVFPSQENISHQRRYKQQNLCEYNQENQEKTEKPEKYNLWLPFILVWRIILILFLFFV